MLLYDIIVAIIFVILGTVMWIKGQRMMSTYNVRIPRWQNREMTLKERIGQIMSLLASVLIIIAIALALRNLV